jgi:two-component system, response regulator, stage 0 sporulation protein F
MQTVRSGRRANTDSSCGELGPSPWPKHCCVLNHHMERVYRILAVDNEPSVTTALRFVFEGPKYDITCVASGADALARLDTSTPYDVIIVDQKMPNLTGVELVREIRKRGVEGKIIVVSANLSADVCEAYQRMDVSLMFSKPFDVRQLRSAVEQLAA